jgi:hypothetical protein
MRMPLSGMEVGPSVRCVFAGVGISDCSCVAEAGDVVVVAELGELPHADPTRPIAIAAAAKA